ncbi:hypothetical protein B0H14DRAFT_2597967 [Mycena olivaceomarginata]|nr:hypothetical protein B0H14DRAFT_2597967 [Mycena olivaceomarginata]
MPDAPDGSTTWWWRDSTRVYNGESIWKQGYAGCVWTWNEDGSYLKPWHVALEHGEEYMYKNPDALWPTAVARTLANKARRCTEADQNVPAPILNETITVGKVLPRVNKPLVAANEGSCAFVIPKRFLILKLIFTAITEKKYQHCSALNRSGWVRSLQRAIKKLLAAVYQSINRPLLGPLPKCGCNHQRTTSSLFDATDRGKTQDSYSQKRRMDIPGYRLMKCWAIYKAATILHPPSPVNCSELVMEFSPTFIVLVIPLVHAIPTLEPSRNIDPAYANQGWKRNPAEAGTDDFSNQGWKRIFPEGTDAYTTLGRKRSAVCTVEVGADVYTNQGWKRVGTIAIPDTAMAMGKV